MSPMSRAILLLARWGAEQQNKIEEADEFGDQTASPKITPTAEAGRASSMVPSSTVSNKGEIEK